MHVICVQYLYFVYSISTFTYFLYDVQVTTQFCQMLIGPISLIFCGHLGDAIQLDGAALGISVSRTSTWLHLPKSMSPLDCTMVNSYLECSVTYDKKVAASTTAAEDTICNQRYQQTTAADNEGR